MSQNLSAQVVNLLSKPAHVICTDGLKEWKYLIGPEEYVNIDFDKLHRGFILNISCEGIVDGNGSASPGVITLITKVDVTPGSSPNYMIQCIYCHPIKQDSA